MARRSLALLLPLVLLASLGVGVGQAADTPDEQYVPPGPPNATQVGVQFMDSLYINMSGYLSADSKQETSDGHAYSTVEQNLCASYDDAFCKGGAAIYYLAHLPSCQDATQVDCIAGLYAVKPDGTKVDATFLRGIPDQPSNPYEGNSKLGIPTTGVDGLWSIPGVTNGGGTDNYVVVAELFGLTSKTMGSSLTQPIPIYSFSAGIYPVQVIAGKYQPSSVTKMASPNGTMRLAWNGPTGTGTESCVAVSTTECALREAFPAQTTFGLSIRLSQEIKGWLHGRIRDPLFDYKSSSSGTSLTVQALPVSVPIVAGWTDRSNLPAVIPGAGVDPLPGTGMLAGSTGTDNMNLLKLWLPLVHDTAQANPTEWVVRNLSGSEMQGANRCMTGHDTLSGFVSTNSSVYTEGPPQFNPDTQSLDYSLVSPHFTSKGEVFKGVYTLGIRSDVARCIYHFTNAPIKATISVTDDAGSSSVAIESMTEHNGWIYLSASNFEFSSPTVHVKLSQDAPVVPIITPSPSPSATRVPPVTSSVKKQSPKTVTISCVKGSLVKKVIAVKPACPKGFKKLAA